MGTIKTTNIEPIADNGTVTLGSSGDTFTLGSGVKQSNLMYPAFEATLSANQDISDATYTKIQFNTETFDTDGCYDNSSNYRFTPTKAGKYFVYARVQCDAQASGNLVQGNAQIYKNGSRVALSQMNMTGNNPENIIVNVHNIIDMNGSSDYLEIFGQCDDNSGTPTIRGASDSAWTSFGAYRIGS
jgi:hypothetical protein